MEGLVYQLNIKPQTVGERGIPKVAVSSVDVTINGFVGDYNKYRLEEDKGDLDKAVLILPLETIVQLNNEGWPVKPGDLGENITTQGIEYGAFYGSTVKIGNVLLAVNKPCWPCKNLEVLPYVGEKRVKDFVKTLMNRRGWYASVVDEGKISVGDKIETYSQGSGSFT